MHDTARQYYWTTNAAGQPEYVTMKRSYSTTGHHKNHDCQYYTVSREEWYRVVSRNRLLDESNQALGAQNDALRLSLSNAEAQISELCGENDSLRHSHGSGGSSPHRRHHHHHHDKSRKKIAKLEKENDRVREENFDLRWRIRELSKQLDEGNTRRTSDLQRTIDHWMRKFHDMRTRYDTLVESVQAKTDKILVYEDILRRNGFI